MDKILSGKPVAERIRAYVKKRIEEDKIRPHILLLRVAGDAASGYYVQNIIRTAGKLGIEITFRELEESINQDELLKMIHRTNDDPAIHGIMVQEPLPKHLDQNIIGSAINPDKDLDSLNPVNLGRIMTGMNGLTPCTPSAVYAMLRYYGIDTVGKHVVIIGRSVVVGKPLANMLLWKNPFADATVSVVHSRSKQLVQLTRQADILIAAMGRAGFVTQDMIKENVIIIDVGINEVPGEHGKPKYVGDVDYNSCYDKAMAITPVPGGVGTVTSSLLFLNLLRAYYDPKKDNKSIDAFLGLIFDEIHNE